MTFLIKTCNLTRFCFLQFMQAVDECRHQEGICENPCEWACKAGGRKAEYRYKYKSDERTRNHFCYSCKHRKAGKTHALYGETDCVYQNERDVEKCIYQQKLMSLCDNLCFAW